MANEFIPIHEMVKLVSLAILLWIFISGIIVGDSTAGAAGHREQRTSPPAQAID